MSRVVMNFPAYTEIVEQFLTKASMKANSYTIKKRIAMTFFVNITIIFIFTFVHSNKKRYDCINVMSGMALFPSDNFYY